MIVTPVQTGNSILRPRARLIKTIGEELISNDIVALLELVKNSYDADASIIVIEFDGTVVAEKVGKKEIRKIIRDGSSIQVYDDGTGMTLKTIKDAWMEPATISKKKSIKSGKTRRYTGEKGIGRFSSAKLSSELEIITRFEKDNEVVARFNWKEFENIDLYLDEVECDWEVREPVEFIKPEHGTKLILKNLNSDWDEEKIRQLRITLQRLINPVVPVTDFLIELRLPKGFESYSGIVDAPESLAKPNHSIRGSVDENGELTSVYTSKKIGNFDIRKKLLLKSGDSPKTGPFEFDFRVWDRDNDALREVASESETKLNEVKAALNEMSGVSIYRDKFRVLPYGDPKIDWLRLDLRRVNNPTLRTSNNQIIGFVTIELEKNPDFKDQSNREGIVDSESFEQLKEFVIAILNELEVKRYEERPREKENRDGQKGLFNRFSISRVVELVETKLPNDKDAKSIVAETEADIQEGVKR
ncbi:ATP-binding protein [Chitinophaga sedimenti]|uniref:ATP-binding protein n=1 Tax=Chitinophaga sedimenti TaxID=2033606 RepID=UPI002004D07F|nr:ATP-binding protein [Chitinophaga sedimenti]MCK7554051.1 ATP-binding protein [Chitinophaga sedimenti]